MSIQDPNPPPLNPGQQIYADLMDEARIRIHALRDAINARNNWAPRLLQEFAYLQLRILCETIGLGCLVAHGDIKKRDTLKRWEIPVIMKEMEKLNPDFYPRAVRISVDAQNVNLADYDAPVLSKVELIKLWKTCGGYLHRGTAADLLGDHGTPLNVNLDIIIEHGQKILNLLEQHIISSADKRSHLIVALSSSQTNGNACVWVAQSPLPEKQSHDSPPKA